MVELDTSVSQGFRASKLVPVVGRMEETTDKKQEILSTVIKWWALELSGSCQSFLLRVTNPAKTGIKLEGWLRGEN